MLMRISEQFKRNAARNAFFLNSKYHTYAELEVRVAAIQSLIDGRRLADNQIIGVVAYSDIETYASILAILFSGHGYLPINPQNPVERNISILRQAGSSILLSSAQDPIPGLALPGLQLIPTLGRLESPGKARLKPVPDTNFAYLLFTSGSTGIPKGVPISRKNLTTFLTGFLDIVDLQASDRVLQMFDLTFDFSVMSLFAPLAVGACVYPADTSELRFMSVYRLLEGQGITCAPMVPSVLAFLRPYFEDIRLDELRFSVFCGEPLYAQIAQEWAVCCPSMRIMNFYGPTEATVFCSVYEWSQSRQKSLNGVLSIGRPMPDVFMLIIDENGSTLPPNSSGELCLAGPQLTSGYWNDSGKDQEAFFIAVRDGNPERFYRTGDIANVDDDGDFMYQGRMDQQVKVQGFRIELTEIEYHARACPGVTQAVAVAVPNRSSGMMEIVLYLENLQGGVNSVLTTMKEKVPGYMVPSRILNIPSLPLNKNGKVDRPALRMLAAS